MHHASPVIATVTAIILLLLLAVVILAATKRIKLPFTVALVVVGIALAELERAYPALIQLPHEVVLTPDLILYVFLPTLIFESTYNLDTRLLRHNLGPILTLAVPGLLISTLLIGLIMTATTSLPLAAALLLGAILSATDPVAVVSMFRQLGAPERLATLLEGESLFNDATAIVLGRIIIGVIIAGIFTTDTLTSGIGQFFMLFFGGILVGIVLGWLTGLLLGSVSSDPFIEISLTTALAYGSFLIAEEVFHLSGVMATVAAGLTLGGWGRMKISGSVREYLEHFWSYLAFIANALIFLLVGLRVNLAELGDSIELLVWVILAMLVARAVVIFGLLPLVGRLPGSRAIKLPYKIVMFWGGLRGAIALALALSLPDFQYSDTIIALTMGAVLFTLVVQGLTIEPLIKRLRVATPSVSDQIIMLERDLSSHQHALARLPRLLRGGQFVQGVSRYLQQHSAQQIDRLHQRIDQLRRDAMDPERERRFVYQRALGEELACYRKMFEQGHMSEGALRELELVINLQTDAIRQHGEFNQLQSHRIRRRLEERILPLMQTLPVLHNVAEWYQQRRVIRDYEELWAHYHGSQLVIDYLDTLEQMEQIPATTLNEVQDHYRRWHQRSQHQLDGMAEQFPELVRSMQHRFGTRLLLLTKIEETEKQAERGQLPHGKLENELTQLRDELRQLRGEEVKSLKFDPHQLLRRVPLFAQLDKPALDKVIQHLQRHTINSDTRIIREGEEGDALLLIARGVVRISRQQDGEEQELGTLMAGDYFGEGALLGEGRRNASAHAITACILYELKQDALEQLMQTHPDIAAHVHAVDETRKPDQ